MKFEKALKLLRKGNKMHLKGWIDGDYIKLQRVKEGKHFNEVNCDYLMMLIDNGTYRKPFTLTDYALLSEDWELFNSKT
jgi:hypothetical protein